ncbi:hypothetical protein ACFLTD_05655 [Elusimicrobiota bacterium]
MPLDHEGEKRIKGAQASGYMAAGEIRPNVSSQNLSGAEHLSQLAGRLFSAVINMPATAVEGIGTLTSADSQSVQGIVSSAFFGDVRTGSALYALSNHVLAMAGLKAEEEDLIPHLNNVLSMLGST